MTKTEVKRYYREHLDDRTGDRIVDVDIFDILGTQHVNFIIVSKNHVVWRNTYAVVQWPDGSRGLRYINTKLLM
jgi:hypothetical protein